MNALDWLARMLTVIGAVVLVYAVVKITVGAWQYMRTALRSDDE